jgi:superfamily II DNA or RNA helicase
MPDAEKRLLREKALRAALWIAANGKCQICGRPLPENWHADHVEPWSATRRTNVHEMQALCPECNLRKGSRRMGDRRHQAELREKVAQTDSSQIPLLILAWVVAGGGKSRLPGILAQRFPKYRVGWFVPRLSLQKQAVESMQKDFGIVLRDAKNETDPSRGTRGFVATHHALMENPALWRDELKRYPYVLVIDEPHHAKVEKDGTHRPLAQALRSLRAEVWLNMSGTLNTNDGTFIYGMDYDDGPDGRLILIPERSGDLYIRYDRMTALREQSIVPIQFHRADGPVKWKPVGGEEREERLSAVKADDEAAAKFTALRSDLAVQLFNSGVDHWRKHSRGRGKLLIVVDSQARAKEYAKRVQALGLSVVLAIDDNDEAEEHIKQFRADKGLEVLITCQMAYEGLDAPTLTHVICLTHIRSAPWIEQMLARVWRAAPGKKQCWAFVPDDPQMNRVIHKIREEQLEAIGEEGEGGPGPGTPATPVLALDGNVDAINRLFLDEGFSCSETRDKLVEFVRSLGLNGDEPEVAALLARLERPEIAPANGRTTAEKERDLRGQIADECRQIDRDIAGRRGAEPRFGETQGRLIRVTNKSIKDMNLEELKHAHTQLQGLRPR